MDLEFLPVQLHSVSGKAVVLNKYPNEGATSLISNKVISNNHLLKYEICQQPLLVTFVITIILSSLEGASIKMKSFTVTHLKASRLLEYLF